MRWRQRCVSRFSGSRTIVEGKWQLFDDEHVEEDAFLAEGQDVDEVGARGGKVGGYPFAGLTVGGEFLFYV